MIPGSKNTKVISLFDRKDIECRFESAFRQKPKLLNQRTKALCKYRCIKSACLTEDFSGIVHIPEDFASLKYSLYSQFITLTNL